MHAGLIEMWVMPTLTPVLMTQTQTPSAGAPAAGQAPSSTQDFISGTAGPTTTSTGAGANAPLGQSGGGQGGGGGMMLFMLPILLGFMILMSVMSSRKEKKRHADLMASIKPGDRVLAAGGLLAQVDKIKDDEVTLKIDENSSVKVKVLRSAIQQVLKSSDSPAEAK